MIEEGELMGTQTKSECYGATSQVTPLHTISPSTTCPKARRQRSSPLDSSVVRRSRAFVSLYHAAQPRTNGILDKHGHH